MTRISIVILYLASACADPKYLPAETPDSAPSGGTVHGTVIASPACRIQFQKSKICLDWNWVTRPTFDLEGSFSFRIFTVGSDQKEVPVTEIEITEIRLMMPSMGHPSAPVSIEKTDIPGVYHARDVFFSMGGDWEIEFYAKRGDDPDDKAVVPFFF